MFTNESTRQSIAAADVSVLADAADSVKAIASFDRIKHQSFIWYLLLEPQAAQ
jgi:hypothetical protein